jgi:hypothetical protein
LCSLDRCQRWTRVGGRLADAAHVGQILLNFDRTCRARGRETLSLDRMARLRMLELLAENLVAYRSEGVNRERRLEAWNAVSVQEFVAGPATRNQVDEV